MITKIENGKCNNPFFARIILFIYYVCLYVLVCDYLSLGVFYLGLVDFGLRRKGIVVILDLGVFWSFGEQG